MVKRHNSNSLLGRLKRLQLHDDNGTTRHERSVPLAATEQDVVYYNTDDYYSPSSSNMAFSAFEPGLGESSWFSRSEATKVRSAFRALRVADGSSSEGFIMFEDTEVEEKDGSSEWETVFDENGDSSEVEENGTPPLSRPSLGMPGAPGHPEYGLYDRSMPYTGMPPPLRDGKAIPDYLEGGVPPLPTLPSASPLVSLPPPYPARATKSEMHSFRSLLDNCSSPLLIEVWRFEEGQQLQLPDPFSTHGGGSQGIISEIHEYHPRNRIYVNGRSTTARGMYLGRTRS